MLVLPHRAATISSEGHIVRSRACVGTFGVTAGVEPLSDRGDVGFPTIFDRRTYFIRRDAVSAIAPPIATGARRAASK